jgi:hypothetical protein
MEDGFEDTTSPYAEEGTRAHELAESRLRFMFGQTSNFIDDDGEMSDYVKVYTDYIQERYIAARLKTSDATILFEQRLDFSDYVPDGFGTGDCVIVCDGTVEVIDLKYGKGVSVSAENNTQMMLYALGVLNQFGSIYEIENVQMTIVQPRLDIISTATINVDALYDWADNYVKPRAQMALVGDGEFVAGEHCRFCKARAICKARADANLSLAQYEFKPPTKLSIEDINDILLRADEFTRWLSDIEGWALDQAYNHGTEYPNFKVVLGRSNRKYLDENKVVEVLLNHGYKEEDIYSRELQSITNLEKKIGKKAFSTILSDLIVKPVGKPTLALLGDKREAISSENSAMTDFQ